MFIKCFHIHVYIWTCEFSEASSVCHAGYKEEIETEKLQSVKIQSYDFNPECISDLASSSIDVG